MYQETLPPVIPDVVVPFVVVVRETTGELASQGRESGARRFKNDLDTDRIVLRGRDKIGGGPSTVVKGNELVPNEVGPCASKSAWVSVSRDSISYQREGPWGE